MVHLVLHTAPQALLRLLPADQLPLLASLRGICFDPACQVGTGWSQPPWQHPPSARAARLSQLNGHVCAAGMLQGEQDRAFLTGQFAGDACAHCMETCQAEPACPGIQHNPRSPCRPPLVCSHHDTAGGAGGSSRLSAAAAAQGAGRGGGAVRRRVHRWATGRAGWVCAREQQPSRGSAAAAPPAFETSPGCFLSAFPGCAANMTRPQSQWCLMGAVIRKNECKNAERLPWVLQAPSLRRQSCGSAVL